MEKRILLSATLTEKRVALLENNKLAELVVERPDQYRMLGNIYRGRVVSILPGIQSAFIDMGLEKNAFLHASDVDPSLLLDHDDDLIERFTNRHHSKRRSVPRVPIEKVLTEGQEVLVQVIKEPIGTKNAKVTTQISVAGRFLVLVPDAGFIGVSKKTQDPAKRRRLKKLIAQLKPPGIGFIVRTIGLQVSETEFVNEIHVLIERWRTIQENALKGKGPGLIYREQSMATRVVRDMFSDAVTEVLVDEKREYDEILSYLRKVSPELIKRVKPYRDKVPLFDKFDVEKDIERSLRRKVWLKSGGYLLFDRGEALLAIDVNTGRHVGRSSLDETIFKTNLEAVSEIWRQLRLRDIGGLIVVDFIDMRRNDHQRRIEDEMRKRMHNDPTAASQTGLSKFGLIEITRKRVRPELQEMFTDICPACNGLGRVFSPATVTTRIDRWLGRPRKDGAKAFALAVHPSVASYLQQEKGSIVRRLEKEHKVHLDVVESDELDPDEFELEPRKKRGRQRD
ncbi:MAG: Rne/Rng family ribonuclease [Chitinivibrionales bacterium]|nr:Rne/Rng family ribonuclease [Chitinivibrionales bacterium]MBD3394688.1 Rne/Rng family ribonuclease [Chitinivibrionales bacterium]